MRIRNWLSSLVSVGRFDAPSRRSSRASVATGTQIQLLDDRILLTGNNVNLSVSANAGTEAGTTVVTVTATTDTPVAANETVDIAVTGAGITGTDYSLSNSQITILTGTMAGFVTFTVQDENLVEEATETATLTMSNPSAGISLGTTTTQDVAITDDDTATYTIDDVAVAEDASTLTFTVGASNPVDTAVDVNVSYGGGSATGSGSDYDSVTDTVTFASGSTTSQTVTVAVNNDNIVELTETFVASLAAGSGTPLGSRGTDFSDTGVGTITDNDTATFTIEDVTVDEGAGDMTFVVALSNPVDMGVDVEVSYVGGAAVGSGTDFDDATDTVTFAAGSKTSQTVTVAVHDDSIVELTEGFVASLAISAGTPLGARSSSASDTAAGTITDNDTATFTIDDVTVAEDAGDITFTVALSNPLDTAVDIDVSYSPGTDYDSSADMVSFAAGSTTSQTVTVTVHEDNIVELTETFTASLAIGSGTPLGARSSSVSDTGTGSITDNDTATFTIEDMTVAEDVGNITFTVALSNPVDTDVDVDVSYDPGTDYDSATDTVTFTSGSTTSQMVTVAVNDDNIVELTESFLASLAIGSGTPLGSRTTDLTDTATGTITDNDTATFTIEDVTVSEDVGDLTFTVALSNPVDTAVDIDVSYAAGTDYDDTMDMVTFAAGSTTSQTVTVAVNDDNIVELSETFLASLAISSSTPLGARASNVSDTATGTITDNDTATFTVEDISVLEDAGTLMFTVASSNPLDVAVDVEVSYGGGTAAPGGTDYDDGMDTVTFAAGSSTSQTVTVAINDDNIVELSETFTASLAISAASSIGTRSTDTSDLATGTITDNDTATFTIDDVVAGEADGSMVFTVSLSNPIDIPLDIDVRYGGSEASAADYDATTDTVMFAAGSTTAQMATVAITSDNLAELTEAITASLAVGSGTPAGARSIDVSDLATGSIVDDDTATFTIDDVSVDEAAGDLTFTVSVSNPVDIDVDVDVSYGGGTAIGSGSDYESTTDTVTFTAGSLTPQLVTVAIVDDNIVELTEAFSASLGISSGTPTGARSIDVTDGGTGTITDNDTATFAIEDLSVDESAGSMTFAVSLSNPIDIPVDIDVSYSNGTASGADYDDSVDAVSFAAGSTAAQTVVVSISDDNIVELAETFTATLGLGSGTPTGARSVDLSDSATGTITDNDAATITIDDVTVAEDAGDLIFTVSMSAPLDIDLDVDVSYGGGTALGGGTDYDSATDTVTFVAGSTSQTVSVAITSDTPIELDETFTASMALQTDVGTRTVTATDTAVGRITDDDAGSVNPGDGVALAHGTLVVAGLTGDDLITVEEVADRVRVTLNGSSSEFTRADVTYIAIMGFDGRDEINHEGSSTLTAIIDAGEGSDIVRGSGAGDLIIGGRGNDRIWAREGDDTVRGGGGRDKIFGGGGNDLLEGNESRDRLIGGNGRDTAIGGIGNDTLLGSNGADSLLGDSGIDILDGGDGDDYANGGIGADEVLGGAGHDTLIGGAGSDLIRGGVGRDLLKGGSGPDYISAGKGADTVNGGSQRDVIHGGDGGDILNGSRHRDLIVGGAGSDVMNGGEGEDILIGGTTVEEPIALNAVLKEWNSGRSYTDRVENIRGVTPGGTRENGDHFLDASTVTDDSFADTLTGGTENDWFFANLSGDSMTDRQLSEELDEII